MITATTAAARSRGPLRGLRGVSVGVLVAAVLAGCASTPPPDAAHSHASAQPQAAVAPTGVPATSDFSSACDVSGSQVGPAQLTSVQLVSGGGQVVLAFALAQPVTGDLDVKVVAEAESAEQVAQAAGFSVTAAVRGGAPVAVVLQTPSGSVAAERPQNLVHISENQVHVGLPSRVLDNLGPNWHWSATSASGADHSACPGRTGSGDPAVVTVGS